MIYRLNRVSLRKSCYFYFFPISLFSQSFTQPIVVNIYKNCIISAGLNQAPPYMAEVPLILWYSLTWIGFILFRLQLYFLVTKLSKGLTYSMKKSVKKNLSKVKILV